MRFAILLIPMCVVCREHTGGYFGCAPWRDHSGGNCGKPGRSLAG